MRGGLSTIDRDYGVFNKIHHDIGTHVVHHLFPQIPHYHLTEATEVRAGAPARCPIQCFHVEGLVDQQLPVQSWGAHPLLQQAALLFPEIMNCAIVEAFAINTVVQLSVSNGILGCYNKCTGAARTAMTKSVFVVPRQRPFRHVQC